MMKWSGVCCRTAIWTVQDFEGLRRLPCPEEGPGNEVRLGMCSRSDKQGQRKGSSIGNLEYVQGDLPSGQGVFGKSGTTDRTGGQALGFRTYIFTFRPQPDSFTPQGLSSSAFLCGLTRPALTEPTLVSGFAPSLSPVPLLSLRTHASNLPVGPAAS